VLLVNPAIPRIEGLCQTTILVLKAIKLSSILLVNTQILLNTTLGAKA
jgi:hypothetical protein